MRKNKWISLIVSVLLIMSVVFAFSFGGNLFAAKVLNAGVTSADTSYEAAQDELKQEVVFVSGTAGVDANVLKAEREEQNPEDDFIVTAIGRNLDTSKKITTAGEEVKEESTVPETKPADVEDPEKVPFDISEPEIFESGDVEYADNQILIKFVKSFDGNVDKELKDAGVGKLESMFATETGDWYVAYLLKDADINETMETVRAMDKVVVAEYNFKSEPASIDTDPISEAVTSNEMAEQQWVLKSCGIQAAWDYLEENGINPGGSSSVTVAVIDTGVDYTHKDLAHNIWVNNDEIPDNNIDDDENGYVDDYYGVDMTSKSGSGMDDHGHGTHVAGIIAAENNDIGVVGIAYNTKVMPVKAGDASGYFLQSNIAESIIYAYSEGADVINMSFGGGASSVAVRDALETAYSRCVLVAAAGNNGFPNEPTDYYLIPAPNYPGDYKFVLGVMSSDINDIESGFSNWDARRFNNNEYEVYAPGNDIMSTIPGDRYASLSGTSMASPVVAAQAALLRSMFNDPDTYPTKFIYGQISGTSENTVSCCNPQRHTVGGFPHNIPGRVNYINSFTNLPKPEISVSDYTIFDTAGFTADTSGIAAEATEANNGDGIIDNGEVIALGFTLRNRWGMGKDTVVSINATNDLGVTNPYVTILNNNVNYGSVGTYSEQDAGRIIDNDMWKGWEKPFYLKIADNCPNDYTITLNVSIESKNGLDESDTTTYGGTGKIVLVVRNGVILPNKITEDMTLTSDNYYIIPNSTIIMEGATVTVEPGTKIQFWTNDPQDSYADTAITYLKVQGQFLCKGTEEEPVEIFPSDWMGQYRVEIYSSDNGFVSMDYTNVANPHLIIERVSNCVFRQNYPNVPLKNRYLGDGKIYSSDCCAVIKIGEAFDCVFYKLGHGHWSKPEAGGVFCRCSFIDSDISYNLSGTTFEKCLFYGNNSMSDGSLEGTASSYTINDDDISFANDKVYYDEINDKYYISILDINGNHNRSYFAECNLPQRLVTYDLLANSMGGNIASINSEGEYAFIADRFRMNGEYDDYWFGIHRAENSIALNYDNTEVPKSITVKNGSLYYGPLNQGSVTFEKSNYGYTDYFMLEVPGNGLATDISLDKYVVNLETGGTYEIEATVKPVTSALADLVFTSENEAVATVDANGMITAIAPGTTQVKVYSKDMAIYNYVTVNVTDYVAIEGLDVAEDDIWINIGESKKLKLVFTPSNTTRTAVTYESLDENVATISSKGVITAISEGNAIINVTGENGLTTSTNVHVVIPVESIEFGRDFYETNIEGEDDTVVTEPTILPEEATNKTLIWESTNPEICTVEDGRLIKNSAGIVTLRATVQNTELSDEITVIVTDNEINPTAVKTVKRDDNYTYAITEAGEIYVWGGGITRPQKMPFENVEDAYVQYGGSTYILDKNGNVEKYRCDWNEEKADNVYIKDETFGALKNIKSLSSSNYISSGYHAIDTSGAVWAWGDNSCGKLGDGSEVSRETPVQIDFDNEIVKILDQNFTTTYLDVNGNMYVSGGNSTRYKTPVQKESGVIDICSSGFTYRFYCETESQFIEYDYYSCDSSNTLDKEHKGEKAFFNSNGCYYYIENGIPYVKGSNNNGCFGVGSDSYVNDYTPMLGVADVKDVIMSNNNSTFVITNDGILYGIGSNDGGRLGIGTTENVSVPTRVEIFSEDYASEQLTLAEWNGSSGTVKSDGRIELTFNIAPKTADDYSMITLKDSEENNVSISKSIDMNKLTIMPKAELTDGATYTLTIPQKALMTRLNGTMAEGLTLTFEFKKSSTSSGSVPAEGDDVPHVDEEIITDDTEETHSIVVDEEKLAQRETVTSASLQAAWEEYCGLNINARFYSNVILNRLNDDDVTGWLRVTAPDSESYQTINLGYNYWGTTNEELINKQILDFDDYQSLADIDESNYLTEAPSDTFPFVTQAYLTVNGGKVDTVGNEEVTFVVDFNRAMDTSIPLDVKFGSSYPYAEYTIDGEYVSDTEWQGTVTLTTLIENGYQYFSISNGKAAGTSLQLYKDWGRFPFKIDTASAQSLLMQGTATEQGIELTWTQDDFETLAGYNVYRSDAEDGLYQRVNKTVIPADTKYLLDDTVEPGVKYYYNFTVVQSDMTESEPSGKVQVTSLDTMAPNIYHTPVATAYKGSNLVISATIIDNVGIETATLYYREAGTTEWKSRTMDSNNDKYSAVVNSSYITDAGLEYYIEAYDGIEYTYKGSSDEPFFVMVQEAFSASDLGDVDGNGFVELKDAMMLLMAVNDRLNLDTDQFKRADLDGNGELSAKEALKIINYINGTISSLN